MPKGDGQGGNQTRPGGTPSVELSKLDILLARMELHREAAKGESGSHEPPEYHAEMADKVWAQIQELVDDTQWKLEALQGGAQLLESMSQQRRTEGDPSELAIAQLDICERTLNTLDEHGVIWVRELVEWTGPMILATRNSGETTLREIRKALADVGLKLREPRRGEEPTIPLERHGVRRHRNGTKDSRKRTELGDGERNRRIIRGLVDGLSGTQINATIGLSKNSNWWPDEIKRRIKKQLASGDSPQEAATFFGFKRSDACFGKIVSYIAGLDSQAR